MTRAKVAPSAGASTAARRSPDALSERTKKYAGLMGSYVKRDRPAGEALPPDADLFKRPAYVPARDNRDGRRVSL